MREDDFLRDASEGQVMSEINVVPFIDIMLVLLIIFMVTAPLMLGGIKVNLPKNAGEAIPRPDMPVIVSLDADSKLHVDRREISPEERHALFRQLARASSKGEVFVRGDGSVQYARMVELMGELGQAGFTRVVLVTELRPRSGSADRKTEARGNEHPADAPPHIQADK